MSDCTVCDGVWNLFSAPISTCGTPTASDCAHTADYTVFWLTSKPSISPRQTPVDLFSQQRTTGMKSLTILDGQIETDRFLLISASLENNSSCGNSIKDLLRNKDEETDNYLVVYEKFQMDSGIPYLRVHLLKDIYKSFICLGEYVVPDCLDEYFLMIWRLTRRIFVNSNGLKEHNQLAASIFCGPATQNPIGLAYLTQILAFVFPHSEWPLYWPWDPRNNLQSRCKGDLQHLLLSASNRAQHEIYAKLFWFYLAVFIVDCLIRHNCCRPTNAFDEFKRELEISRQHLGVFVNYCGGEPLVYFLTGLSDPGDYYNPIVVDILEKFLLPYLNRGDVALIPWNLLKGVGARILQQQEMCKLIADFEPEFIVTLLEDSFIQRKNLHLLCKSSGSDIRRVIPDWLWFIFPIYLDCLMQLGLGGREQEIKKRFIRVFSESGYASRIVEIELYKLLSILPTLTSSLLCLAKSGTRSAYRKHLMASAAPRISLTQFINQLHLPRNLKAFLATPAIQFEY